MAFSWIIAWIWLFLIRGILTSLLAILDDPAAKNTFLVRMIKQQTIYPVDTLSKTNEMLAALLAQLRGMAANMNQIAKIANSRQEVPSMNYLRYILAAVQNLKEESQPVFTSLREVLHGNR